MRSTELTPELLHSAYLVFQNHCQRPANRNNKDFNDQGGRGIECIVSQEEFTELYYRTECYELCGTLLNDEGRKRSDRRPGRSRRPPLERGPSRRLSLVRQVKRKHPVQDHPGADLKEACSSIVTVPIAMPLSPATA